MPRNRRRSLERAQRPGIGGPEHGAARGQVWNVGNLPPPRFKVEAHPPPDGMPAVEWPTLREVVAYKLWRNTQLGIAPQTEKVQRGVLCRALAELPARPVPADVIEWHVGLVNAAGQKPSSADKCVDYLSGAYELARALGAPIANPCKLVNRFGDAEADPAQPALGGPEEAAAIYERTRVVCDDEEKGFFAIGFWGGARKGETLALLPDEIRNDGVHVTAQRSGASRDTPRMPRPKNRSIGIISRSMFPEREWAELVALARRGGGTYRAKNQFGPLVQSPYLFPWSDESMRNGLLRKLRAVAPEHFPPGKAFHQLRHVAAEAVDEQTGGAEDKLQQAMRWKSARSARRYLAGRRGTKLKDADAAAIRDHRMGYTPKSILRAVAPRSRQRMFTAATVSRTEIVPTLPRGKKP